MRQKKIQSPINKLSTDGTFITSGVEKVDPFSLLICSLLLLLFFCIYKCLWVGHQYKQKSSFTPLISNVVVFLGFGLMIRMFFWWRGLSLLTLCCRRASCGCCCHCALWFQSYPAWETLFHFLPSAVISCRGGGNAEVRERSETPSPQPMTLK